MYHYNYRKRSAASAADLRKAIERGNYAAVKRTITRNRYLTHCPTGRAADHPVHVAAQSGHQRIVGLLLHRGADPNARNAYRKTPTHLGVLHCRPLVVDLLIDNGADPAVVDGSDNTPLDLAALMNNKRCLDVLLNHDMPNSVLNKALFKAATQDNTILMNKLLNRGAHIEHVDESTGFTSLLVAMKTKHVRASQFLLEKGANPTVRDHFGWTCLHLAVYYDYPHRTLLMILDGYGASKRSVDSRTCNQETALHLAAKRGNGAAAAELLRAGAHVDAVDRKNRTPLLTAMHRQKDAVAALLVQAGASVNHVAGSAGAPLHAAVARNHLSLARLMLEHGSVVVDPRGGDDHLDWTVVHSACESGDTEMLECLLAYTEPGALQALHAAGRLKPPIVVAASTGHRAAVDALLARGVDVNARCRNGETALHAAVRANRAAMVDRLLDAGACIDARDAAAGRRPLDVSVYTWGRRVTVTAHLVHSDRMAKAVVRHDVDAVAFLLACGVSPNMTTEAYGSPLHAAVRHRRYRMMAALLSSDRCRTAVRHNGVTPLDYAVAMDDARAAKMIQWRDLQRRCRRTRHASLAAVDRRRPSSKKHTAPRDSPSRRTSI